MNGRASHRGRRLTGLVALTVLVVVVLAATGVLPFRQIFAQQEAVGLAEAQLAALREETGRLEREIEALQTPAEIERLAREQFGYVRPGEIGYVVVSPPGSEAEPRSEPEPMLDHDDTPWWRDLWDWLTGRDLLEDG